LNGFRENQNREISLTIKREFHDPIADWWGLDAIFEPVDPRSQLITVNANPGSDFKFVITFEEFGSDRTELTILTRQ
jgi:hypothetical protein